MKCLILFLSLISISTAFAGIQYKHVNDGLHMLAVGDTFIASEDIVSSNDTKKLQGIRCTAVDTAKLKKTSIHWTMNVNDYSWNYTLESWSFFSWKILPPGDAVYQIIIKGAIDPKIYKGPFVYVRCDSYDIA